MGNIFHERDEPFGTAGDQTGSRHGRTAHRVHGKCCPSPGRRVIRPGFGNGRSLGMTLSLEPIQAGATPVSRHPDGALRRFVSKNRASIGTLAVFVVMMAVFIIASPQVFTHWQIYDSVLVTLPVALWLAVPLAFGFAVRQIDLSFPATMCF